MGFGLIKRKTGKAIDAGAGRIDLSKARWAPFALVDGRVVIGQNPASSLMRPGHWWNYSQLGRLPGRSRPGAWSETRGGSLALASTLSRQPWNGRGLTKLFGEAVE